MCISPQITSIFAEEGSDTPRRARWWFLIPLLVAVVAVAFLHYRQQVVLVPIPSRPMTGSLVDSRTQVGFTWTKTPGKPAEYAIQIAADCGFKKMPYETRVKDMHEIVARRAHS